MAHFWLVNDQSLGWFGVSPFSEIPWISAKMIMYIYICYICYIYIYVYICYIYIYDDDILYTLCVLGIPTVSSKGKFVGRALVDVLTTPSRHALIVASRNEAQTNGGFGKMGVAKKDALRGKILLTWMIWGYPYFQTMSRIVKKWTHWLVEWVAKLQLQQQQQSLDETSKFHETW